MGRINLHWIFLILLPICTAIDYDLEIENYLDDELFTGSTYSALFKITNLYPNNGSMYNVTVTYNITKDNTIIKLDKFIKSKINYYTRSSTGSFSPNESGQYTVCGLITNSTPQDKNSSNNQVCTDVNVTDTTGNYCDITISLDINKNIYNEGEKIDLKYKLNDESYPFIIQYWIEDLKGNIHKRPYNSTNTNKKTWTTSTDGTEAFYVKAKLMYIGCNDTNSTNNNAQFLFVVNNSYEYTTFNPNSSITIERVYQGNDNKSKFGEHVRVKVIVYKGDTTKTSVQAYIEDNSNTKISSVISRANVGDKFTLYKFTLPIQTKPNCNEIYKNGTFTLVVTGLDQTATIPVVIEGITDSLCEEKLIEPSQDDKKESEYSITTIPSRIYPDKSFTTKIRIENNEDIEHEYFIWGYLYRSSKCYSGTREANLEKITISEESQRTISLKNRVNKDTEEGSYKYKVKIKRDDRKTTKDLTRDIEVIEKEEKIELIKSFYTRAKNYKKEITLYTKINTGDKKKKIELKLHSFLEEQEKNISIKGSETIEFKAKILPGKNKFFLIVKENNKVIDIKELTLWVNETCISTAKQEITNLNPSLATSETLSATVQKINERPYYTRKERILYESPAAKAKKLIAPLIIILLALITLGCVIKSKP